MMTSRMATALRRAAIFVPFFRAPPSSPSDNAPARRPTEPVAAARIEIRGSSVAEPGSGRDLRLDFFRGTALLLIFIDHVPGNVLMYFTAQALGFSDAAEIFIFISGYTAALVFGRTLVNQGAVIAAAKILHRVWQLYVAHIFIFLLFTALVSYHTLTFENSMIGRELHVAKFFTEPYKAVIRVLELRFQPNFLDILPLYMVLLAGFPVALLLLRRHALAVLVPSLALYIAVQVFGLALHGYPGNRAWLFNPLAWQLLFIIGATCGFARHDRRPMMPPPLGRLVGPAAIIVGAALIIKVSWSLHAVANAIPAILIGELWPIDKSNLAPIRLLHFLALATIVVHFTAADAPFLRWRVAQPIVRCGQFSLQIFCLGILLSVIGHFILEQWSATLMAQLAVNAAGWFVMIGTATLIGWYRTVDRATTSAKAPA